MDGDGHGKGSVKGGKGRTGRRGRKRRRAGIEGRRVGKLMGTCTAHVIVSQIPHSVGSVIHKCFQILLISLSTEALTKSPNNGPK